MPKITAMDISGSRHDNLLVSFEYVTDTFRKSVIAWLKKQYGEFVKMARWQDGKDNNVLLIEIWRTELAIAITAVKQAIQRRALFK